MQRDEQERRNNEPFGSKLWLCVGAVTMLALLYLLPSLQAGYSEGDIALAHLTGYAQFERMQTLTALHVVNSTLRTEQGGWFPLGGLNLLFWLVKPSPVLARAVAIVTVASDLALFFLVVQRFTQLLQISVIAALGTLLALQFRKPHDAILGGTLQLPVLLALLMFAMLAAFEYNTSGKMRWLVCALCLEAVVCSIDAIGYPVASLVSIILFMEARNRTYAWLSAAIPIIFLATGLGMRSSLPSALRWITRPTFPEMRRTVEQLLASLPTSYRAFGNVLRDGTPDGTMDSRFLAIPPISALGSIVSVAAGVAIYVALATLRVTRERFGRTWLPLASVTFVLLLSSSLLHDSGAWQGGMPIGEADRYVIVGYFGFGLALALVLNAISTFRATTFVNALVPPIGALIFFLIFFGNTRTNDLVVAFDRDQHETWKLLNDAGAARIFATERPGATFVYAGRALSTVVGASGFRSLRYLLFQVSGKRFSVAPLSSVYPGGPLCAKSSVRSCIARSDVWFIQRETKGTFEGGLVLEHWKRTVGSSLQIDRALVYRGNVSDSYRDALANELVGARRGLKISNVKKGSGWLMAQAQRTCEPVEIGRAFKPDAPDLSFGVGFLPGWFFQTYQFAAWPNLAAGLGEVQNWRYGTARAVLVIHPDGCVPESIRVTANVFAPEPTLLTIIAGSKIYKVGVGEAQTTIDVPVQAVARRPLPIVFITPGRAAPDAQAIPQFDRRRFPPAHLLVWQPGLSIAPTPKSNE